MNHTKSAVQGVDQGSLTSTQRHGQGPFLVSAPVHPLSNIERLYQIVCKPQLKPLCEPADTTESGLAWSGLRTYPDQPGDREVVGPNNTTAHSIAKKTMEN